jgi:hypothetical protein
MSQYGTFGFGFVKTITGNTGGPISPIASNLDILGSGVITISGNDITGTLTVSAPGVANEYDTDIGGPVVATAGGVLNVFGGHNITTDGTIANTIVFNLTGTTNHAVQVGDSLGSLNSLPLALDGEGLMGSTGADPFWTGSPSFSGTVTAGTGFTATTGNVAITAGNLTLPTTTSLVGQIIVNSVPFMHSYGTHNIFIGPGAGDFTLDATNSIENIGIGGLSLSNLAGTGAGEASRNTAIGYSGLLSCTVGSYNTAGGYASLQKLTIGQYNSAYGALSLNQLVSGNYCTSLGENSGFNYTTNESSNICIGYGVLGTVAESNVLRIGAGSGVGNGQLNAAFISGIYNKTIGGTSTVVLSDSTDQIGGLPAGTAAYVLTQGATAPSWQPTLPGGITWTRETGDTVAMVVNHGYINTNVALTAYTLPVTAALGTIIAVMGESAAGWQIQQNAGQNIQIGFVSTATGLGGGLQSTNQYDVVYLVCRVPDLVWSVVSSMGNILVA